jgi:DNA segregation ATPase FtsK/SpoIIIE, S-DNA-T family
MNVACSQCGAKYVLKDAEIVAHPKVQFTCPKCGKTTVVKIEQKVDATIAMLPLPSFARPTGSSSGQKMDRASRERLPESISAELSVIAGPDTGMTFNLQFVEVIVGRQGADVELSDPEISRQHCLLEVKNNFIQLKDLDSTNGTYYEEERVRAAMLRDGTAFRVGSTVLRVALAKR